MNHEYVDEHEIAARYVSRTLSADEEREFEAHLVDCPRCIDDVQFGEALRTGLRRGALDTANRETQTFLAQSGTPCIEKPFRVQQLIATVEKTFGKP